MNINCIQHSQNELLSEKTTLQELYLARRSPVLVSYTGSLDIMAIYAQVATLTLKSFWLIEAFWGNIKQTFSITKNAFATAPGAEKSILVTWITPLGTQWRGA